MKILTINHSLLLILYFPIAVFSQTITTIAGTGAIGFSGDDGYATSANLNSPSGVFSDPSGTIYIADTYNNKIRKITSSGIISTVTSPSSPINLNSPWGVVTDASGSIYIADTQNNRIIKLLPSGLVATIAGNGISGYGGDGGLATSAKLSLPYGLSLDAAGNIYIADYGNNRIRKVSPSGIITTVAGTSSVGFSGDNGPATAANLYHPTGVHVDSSGTIYIADLGNNRVRKVSSAGIIVTIAGTGSSGYSGDNGPAVNAKVVPGGICKDGLGNVIIADYGNHCIRKISISGIINTVAGTGIYGDSGDGGPALSATFMHPFGISADASGNIFVADYTSHKIRKISVLSTGLNDVSKTEKFNVFPNPSSGNFKLNTAELGGERLMIEIFNGLGEKINLNYLSDINQSEIDLSSQPNGIYYIKIKSGKESFTRKIIIQK